MYIYILLYNKLEVTFTTNGSEHGDLSDFNISSSNLGLGSRGTNIGLTA
jgi:hypothetical protein